MRISDWSSDVCSSDLWIASTVWRRSPGILRMHCARRRRRADAMTQTPDTKPGNYYVSIVRGKDHRLLAGPFVNNHAGALAMVDAARDLAHEIDRSEEHTSALQSLMRISYAVFCLKQKQQHNH